MLEGKIFSISISPERGQLKKEVPEVEVIENHGIKGDGHAGDWGRQVTCLSWNSVEKANLEHGLNIRPGDFAENILIEGLDLSALLVGDQISISDDTILEITQVGKEDHPSIVTKTFGVSLLPYEGLFCKVIRGGKIKKGDRVVLTAKR